MHRLQPIEWVSQIPELLRRLGQWWWQGLRDFIPDKVASWLLGRGRGRLAIDAREDAIDFELMNDRGEKLASLNVQRTNYRSDLIGDFVSAHGFDRTEVDLGIRLPAEKFFIRRLSLPTEAYRDVDEITAQDLARKTPFRSADVFCGHATTRAAGSDKITVVQWVVRREIVTQAVEAIQADPSHLAFVDADARTEEPSPLIWLRPNKRSHRSWTARAALALCCSALILALADGGLRYRRQQAALDDLEVRIAAARPKAQQVRAAIDGIEKTQRTLTSLRARKGERPGLIEVWEEATRVLPSHSWVTELRLVETAGNQEQQLILTGFSAAATQLVGLIDRSPLFADVALTAPIALDPIEGRERFVLQAKIKKLDVPHKEASR